MEINESILKRLARPRGPVDVVLDTDAYNEIDDQFAIAYMMKSPEMLRPQAIYAAPFFNSNSTGPADGMERSYQEILKLLSLMGRKDMKVFRGSNRYLPDENTPVESDAARDLADRAMRYSEEHPLYVVAIGAITNVASALLLRPEIKDRIVVVWLGGHSREWPDSKEFNMFQDVAAARIIFGCGLPLVQLPCMGVVSHFTVSGVELEAFLRGKNALCDYLVDHTEEEVCSYCQSPVWSRVIWDVTAVGWLMGKELMWDETIPAPIPQYDHHYSSCESRHPMKYVYYIHRDGLLRDLVEKLTR